MKFAVEFVSNNSGRLGKLQVKQNGPEIATPMMMLTTKGGSIPWVPPQVFELVTRNPQMVQLTASTMGHMDESLAAWNNMERGVSDFVGFPDHGNVFFLRDPCITTPSGSNEGDSQPLFTRRGKVTVTAERYMEMVARIQPDIYQGLSDADTNGQSSKKRGQKSVERTEKFMQYIYQQRDTVKSVLLAPIVGGYDPFARTRSIKHAREQPSESYGGYVLEGFHNNGLTATTVDAAKLLPIVKHCVGQLEAEKPRMIPGAYTPTTIIELVGLGMDVFDTSYAFCATNNFKALTFTFLQDGREHSPFLDITDEAIKDEFGPLLSGCVCLACRRHSRAYVHHLYRTNELLGSMLLMVHNLHHLVLFFEAIRENVGWDTLPQLKELVRMQNRESPVDYSIAQHTQAITNANMDGGFAAAPAV
ncbi:hypothetical protein KR018_004202 [Drosophila ironensis]|nr:hypothetical protein KR018_004202 [Drosophila ironensis]